MLRTNTAGELSPEYVEKKVTLCGWVENIRRHGKIGFILLRDRYGTTQIFLNPNLSQENQHLTKESVIKVIGTVNLRPKNQVNPDMKTGEIEVAADSIEVLAPSAALPLDFNSENTEETRLKYRYLDLRQEKIQDKLILRHKVLKVIHNYLDANQFVHVETPLLAKSTPEGSRDYLVPSRTDNGKFYALPQSPQIFKQLLMIAGFDRYYQVARCLRDEDLRSDRQPEFTQIDMEMSFVEVEDIILLVEKMMKQIFSEAMNINLSTPFERITYAEAMKKYNSDKPDLRKPGEEFKFAWVTDFPLFEYSETEKRFVSAHHPFTSPAESDQQLLETGKLGEVRAKAYDLVLNGYEVGGGSIRIHDAALQKKIFHALQLSEKDINDKFGFFVEALSYGTPPHGGLALGLDRILAIMTKSESIREVIAFPKNKDAKDLMMESPSTVTEEQLQELGLQTRKK